MSWEVLLLDEVEAWFLALIERDPAAGDRVTAAIDRLSERGPSLGRPTVDRIKGSAVHNMKELRPPATSIRILFVFDRRRRALLVVAGDKTGDWTQWYDRNVPVADRRYNEWLRLQHEEEGD